MQWLSTNWHACVTRTLCNAKSFNTYFVTIVLVKILRLLHRWNVLSAKSLVKYCKRRHEKAWTVIKSGNLSMKLQGNAHSLSSLLPRLYENHFSRYSTKILIYKEYLIPLLCCKQRLIIDANYSKGNVWTFKLVVYVTETKYGGARSLFPNSLNIMVQ